MSAARLCLLVGLLTLACAEPPATPPRPNVLLVVLDTLRTDHLSAYGYEPVVTRNLDEFAAQGVLFEDCLAQASWTMPSMISLMTGQPLFQSIYRIPSEVPVIAEHFAAGGYRTGAFVANSLVGSEAGFDRGVTQFQAREKLHRQWDWRDVITRGLNFIDDEPALAPHDSIPADVANALSDKPRSQADHHEPFFLWLHFLDTHSPYEPKRKDPERPVNEVLGVHDLATARALLESLPDDEAAELYHQLPELADSVQRYDAELRQLDAALGYLFRALHERGLDENTYVLVAADHGETLFRRRQHPDRLQVLAEVRADRGESLRLSDRLKMEHDGWLYDELVRTPLILRGPDLPRGRRVDSLVTNLDILPTLLGLAGLPVPRTPGRDLAPALRGDTPVQAAEFAVSACGGAMAARTPEGRKVVLYSERLKRRHQLVDELFDLRSDPLELQPLALDEAANRLAERLRAAAEADPFQSFYSAPDDDTLQALRELGYVR
ncbi:MAG: arylsulfatase A family protein [Planctomycetota bacterium]|nr:MAG: arylsulfatase A family protein [Planctomycetota bacterium]